MSFNGRKHARNEQMDRRFMFMKIFWAQGAVRKCHLMAENMLGMSKWIEDLCL